jgi:hypothetical protein
MKLFSIFNKEEIIKTNPELKPSIRYESVLFNQLQKEAYNYIKSRNTFSQDFKFGKMEVALSYNSSFGYISSVQYYVDVIFTAKAGLRSFLLAKCFRQELWRL